MKQLYGIFMISWLICGCAPTVTHLRQPGMETFSEVSRSLVIGTTTKDDISKKFGIPTTKTYFASGIEQWKYFYSRRWINTGLFAHLGTYAVMDKVICFSFNRGDVLVDFSYEETPE